MVRSSPDSIEIRGEDAAYLMGGVPPAASSVLTSTSSYLNNPRFRDVYAQMGLKRDGHDIPSAYLIPEVNRAMSEELDFAALDRLLSEEKERLPEFAQWLDQRFLSDWSTDLVVKCADQTVGRLIFDFLTSSGMNIDFMFRGAPANDYEYLTKRRVQNHDIEHLVTGLDPSPVGEIALIVANAVAIHRYFAPEFAQILSLQPMFLASTSLMRMACHYPKVMPAMLEGIARGYALGESQVRPLFMIRWEDWINVPVAEARRQLGFADVPPDGHWNWTFEEARG
jgi:ubiquinone biosynthesis protein COQ4